MRPLRLHACGHDPPPDSLLPMSRTRSTADPFRQRAMSLYRLQRRAARVRCVASRRNGRSKPRPDPQAGAHTSRRQSHRSRSSKRRARIHQPISRPAAARRRTNTRRLSARYPHGRPAQTRAGEGQGAPGSSPAAARSNRATHPIDSATHRRLTDGPRLGPPRAGPATHTPEPVNENETVGIGI